jgi:hypothetical protein
MYQSYMIVDNRGIGADEKSGSGTSLSGGDTLR